MLHGRPIRGPHLGDARGNLHVRLRIDEQRFSAGGELALRRIDDVQHRHVVPHRAETTHGRLDLAGLHQ